MLERSWLLLPSETAEFNRRGLLNTLCGTMKYSDNWLLWRLAEELSSISE